MMNMMNSPQLAIKKVNKSMESYSIIGDLISYIRCPRSYRKIQRGNLNPSRPSQMWFGNFLHGVMEALFTYSQLSTPIPLPLRPTCGITSGNPPVCVSQLSPPQAPDDIDYFDYNDEIHVCQKNCSHRRCLYKICDEIRSRLAAERLYARSKIMTQSAFFRVYLFVELFSRELFPLISAAEIPLKGVRNYSNGQPLNQHAFSQHHGLPTDVFYEVHGIADVISQISISQFFQMVVSNLTQRVGTPNTPRFHLIQAICGSLFPSVYQQGTPLQAWLPQVSALIPAQFPDGFEIIIDYKGQSRPSMNGKEEWQYHDSQMRTYKWLREQQSLQSPVILGILIYINELYPSKDDLKTIVKDSKVTPARTDEPLDNTIINLLETHDYEPWIYLQNVPEDVRAQRAIRIIDFRDANANDAALTQFDQCVLEIECCMALERNTGTLKYWRADGDDQTCGTCDARYSCLRERGKKTIKTTPTAP